MTELIWGFLVGVLVGFTGGSIAAYYAFNKVTVRLANSIMEIDETCHQ